MVGGSHTIAKNMCVFVYSVMNFVGVVQSSRLAEIDQHLILGFGFFYFEKNRQTRHFGKT